MFQKLTPEIILNSLEKRINPILDLSKVPGLAPAYLDFLGKYEEVQFTPDVQIYGYERALNENRRLERQYPEIAKVFWLIGGTGQGDDWFLARSDGQIYFYDHEQGEYEELENFNELKISFVEFLQMGSLYQQLEAFLDETDELEREISTTEIADFRQAIASIHPGLSQAYPFQYF